MIEEQRRKLSATAISLLVHAVIFVVVCMTGLFAMMETRADDEIYDVTLYEAPSAPKGGSEADAASPKAPAAKAATPTIAVPKEAALPQIAEEYTKQPEKQKEFRKAHGVPETVPQDTGSGQGESATAAGSGTGDSPGNGGSDSGEGSGGNSGGGSDEGNIEPARDPELARQPKTRPRILSEVSPQYPQRLADEGIEGQVRVRMIVSASGSVESAEVSSSSGYRAMDKAAVQAAYGYSFSPALNVYGEPVRCAVTRTVRFVLR